MKRVRSCRARCSRNLDAGYWKMMVCSIWTFRIWKLWVREGCFDSDKAFCLDECRKGCGGGVSLTHDGKRRRVVRVEMGIYKGCQTSGFKADFRGFGVGAVLLGM